MYPWLTTAWRQWYDKLLAGRLAHGWLITGPSGLGQALLAQQMATGHLCAHPATTGPCGLCHACQLLARGHHPDLLALGAENERALGIDAIRELITKLNATPQLGEGKVAIIHHAERMTEAAANALLKTLEEPAGRSLILLLSEYPDRLLPTIRSRCQRLALHAPALPDALHWLQAQPGGETAAPIHLVLNQGAPLRALDYLTSGLDRQRQTLFQALSSYLQSRQQLPALLAAFEPVMAQAVDWLSLLLLDALKCQAGASSTDYRMSDAQMLIQRLAALPTARLLALHQGLRQLQSTEEAFATAMPSLHLLAWCRLFYFEENHAVS
ncbi:DNA polymerase III subunit delta' [Pseudaeromonas sharmana]|uniref:DNA polymerase III subunit delta' n=1 Tax=Pseudaeromonas sharmana TaxID=328412 RepID=A0ABV8CQ97_9GAMM